MGRLHPAASRPPPAGEAEQEHREREHTGGARGRAATERLALDLGDLDNGDIEGTATQVIDRDLGIAALLVHAIGQRGRGRLVDDALHIQTGDPSGILGGLALRVVEVGRYGNHRLGHFIVPGVLLLSFKRTDIAHQVVDILFGQPRHQG